MKTNNEIIAEFMGGVHTGEYNLNGLEIFEFPKEIPIKMASEGNCHRKYTGYLKFDTSWDWLMPVVKKLYEVVSEHDRTFAGLTLFEVGLATPIDDVYADVVDAIKFHNSK